MCLCVCVPYCMTFAIYFTLAATVKFDTIGFKNNKHHIYIGTYVFKLHVRINARSEYCIIYIEVPICANIVYLCTSRVDPGGWYWGQVPWAKK